MPFRDNWLRPWAQRFEQHLQNIQSGDNWKQMCSTAPTDFHGHHFDTPTSCANWVSFSYPDYIFSCWILICRPGMEYSVIGICATRLVESIRTSRFLSELSTFLFWSWAWSRMMFDKCTTVVLKMCNSSVCTINNTNSNCHQHPINVF